MKERGNNKYVVFPICMIFILIASSIYSYRNQFYDNGEILQRMDMTGYTTVFLIIFLIINIGTLSLCLYMGKKSRR